MGIGWIEWAGALQFIGASTASTALIPGLIVDLNPSNSQSLSSTGSLVDQISGINGTIYNATGAGATRPSLGTQDGVPVIEFGGAHVLDIPGIAAAFPETGYTLVRSIYLPVVTRAFLVFVDIAKGASTGLRDRVTVYQQLVSGSMSLAHRKASATANVDSRWNSGSEDGLDNTWRFQVDWSDPGNSIPNLQVDNFGQTAAGVAQELTYGFDTATIGARRAGGVYELFTTFKSARERWYNRVLTGSEIAALKAEHDALIGAQGDIIPLIEGL
jgi:hypothetical protein